MVIEFVVAMSENHVIGIDGQLPWHLPSDLKHFKALTLGEHVLMGRKTFASIGRALPKRHNLVLTRDTKFTAPDVDVVHEPSTIFARDFAKLMVIGGEEIFRLFLPQCQRIHLTLVHTTIEGDTFFPSLDGFLECSRQEHPRDDRHHYRYSFVEYVRA